MNQLRRLDGRHKLAVLAAVVCWGLSMWFSYMGFAVGNDKLLFVGWLLAGVVTVVELVFNSQTKKLSLTLIVVGILCYGYGIWTNITGFWDLQHPGEPFVVFQIKSVMPIFVGLIMEVLPEPLFMWGSGAKMDGDPIGNLIGLWKGDLAYAEPSTGDNQPQQTKTYSNIPSSIPKAQHQRPQGDIPPFMKQMMKDREKGTTLHKVRMVEGREADEMKEWAG